MSQAGSIGAGGMPTVATDYVTDNGTATPAANILNVLGNDTTANNVNGIQTTGSGNTVTVELTNRISVTATTVGATVQSVTLLTPSNDTGFTHRLLISGYDATNDEVSGGELIGLGRKEGGVVTIIADNDVFSDFDAALGASDWDVVANGGDVDIQFTGVAGRTIVWRALYEYMQSP